MEVSDPELSRASKGCTQNAPYSHGIMSNSTWALPTWNGRFLWLQASEYQLMATFDIIVNCCSKWVWGHLCRVILRKQHDLSQSVTCLSSLNSGKEGKSVSCNCIPNIYSIHHSGKQSHSGNELHWDPQLHILWHVGKSDPTRIGTSPTKQTLLYWHSTTQNLFLQQNLKEYVFAYMRLPSAVVWKWSSHAHQWHKRKAYKLSKQKTTCTLLHQCILPMRFFLLVCFHGKILENSVCKAEVWIEE